MTVRRILSTSVFLFSLLFGQHALADSFSVITDEEAFFSLYERPEELINFQALKDGAQFDREALHSPLVFYTASPPFWVGVRESAWSEQIDIGTTSPGCGCAWTGTEWHGDRVSPERQSMRHHLYLSVAKPGVVISAKTSAGFFGFVPQSDSNMFYVLPYDAELFSVGLGYALVSSVPEPAPYGMLIAGMLMVAFVASKRSRAAARLPKARAAANCFET